MFTRHVTKLLTRYADGELPAASVQRVETHLAACARCRSALEGIRLSARLVRQLHLVNAPPTVWNGIAGALSEKRPMDARRSWAWAVASVAVLTAIGGGYWWTQQNGSRSWQVVSAGDGSTRRMAAGDWVETTGSSKARIYVADVGTVDLGPDTRVQLGNVNPSEHRLSLARGTINAEVNAPPRFFIVDTPASTVVDLGCAYTVSVASDGTGQLRMTSGWAELEWKDRRSLVPAGAVCRTQSGAGPGTPYFEDASATLKRAVDNFDSGGDAAADVEVIVREARVRDTLTLWHLLSRVGMANRVRVYERIAELAPPPLSVSRERALALDPEALRKWREELAWKW